MTSPLRIPLQTTPAQRQRLEALQRAFAEACNALAPLVQKTRCWNRVALHHMAYRGLRERFPGIGSQMACNAIYSVSRASRLVYQHPKSPFNIAKVGDRPLPQLRFTPQAPVYFDRHTLSIKHGSLSMFTLDGRMRFEIDVNEANERRFRNEKLREILLTRSGDAFTLTFIFGDTGAPAAESTADLPEYVVIDDAHESTPSPLGETSIPALT